MNSDTYEFLIVKIKAKGTNDRTIGVLEGEIFDLFEMVEEDD